MQQATPPLDPAHSLHGRNRLQRAAMHQAQPLLPSGVFAQHHKATAGCMVRHVVGRLTLGKHIRMGSLDRIRLIAHQCISNC
eukprot:289771-Pelagomonas_calceolata.AAC.1